MSSSTLERLSVEDSASRERRGPSDQGGPVRPAARPQRRHQPGARSRGADRPRGRGERQRRPADQRAPCRPTRSRALVGREAGGDQGVGLDQFISGHAVAHGDQTSDIDQTGADDAAAGTGATPRRPARRPIIRRSARAPTTRRHRRTAAGDGCRSARRRAAPRPPESTPGRGHRRDSGRDRERQPATTPAAAGPRLPASLPTRSSQPTRLSRAAAVTTPDVTGASLDGGLLNVDVNVDLDSEARRTDHRCGGAERQRRCARSTARCRRTSARSGRRRSPSPIRPRSSASRLQDVTAEAITHQDATIDQ